MVYNTALFSIKPFTYCSVLSFDGNKRVSQEKGNLLIKMLAGANKK